MSGSFGRTASFRGATAVRAGAMSSSLYSQLAGTPPTDPTTALPTTGASGSYTDITATNVVSSLDPSITDLAYDMSFDTGHKATKTLVPWILLPGLGLSKAAIGATCRHRFASYANVAGTRAPLPIAVTLRGRGNGGNQRYVRDTQDIFDILAAAVDAAESAGCTVYGGGRCAVFTGYSTGAIDLLLALARRSEGVLAGACFYPNFDLGYDADDGYYQLVSSVIRSTYLDSRVGIRGQGTPAELDPYMARNAVDGLPRMLAISGSPDLWVFGDETEAPLVPIPAPARLVSALRSHPPSKSKTRGYLTTSATVTTSDTARVLHDQGVDGAGTILAERRYVRDALDAEEWALPRETPVGGLRVFGWMAAREITSAATPADNRPGWELWTGPNANPRSDEPEGGTLHTCELQVYDAGKQFVLDVVSSQKAGYYEVLRDGDIRRGALDSSGRTIVRMNESPTLASLSAAGFTDVWHSSDGVTGTTTVTAWAAVTGGRSFVASANHPSTATDGDSKTAIRFTLGSSTKMTMNSLLVDPREDFTIALVLNDRTGTANAYWMELRRKADTSALSLWRSSGARLSYLLTSGGASGLAGAIEQPAASAAKRWIVIQRKSDVMSLSVDGAVLIKSAVTADAFNVSTTVETLIGGRLDNSGTVYFQFSSLDYYTIAAAQSAIARPLLDASWSFCKTHDGF